MQFKLLLFLLFDIVSNIFILLTVLFCIVLSIMCVVIVLYCFVSCIVRIVMVLFHPFYILFLSIVLVGCIVDCIIFTLF